MNSIRIEDGKLLRVIEFETDDNEIVSYFSELDEKERVERFKTVIKTGVVALKIIGTTEKVDYVEKAFEKLKTTFENEIKEHFGENGKIVKDIFDPAKPGTPLYELKVDIERQIQTLRDTIGGKKIAEEKTTLKGKPFEDYCDELLHTIAKYRKDIHNERTTEKYGAIKNCRKGDFVVTLNERPDKKIVIETKDWGTISESDIRSSLAESLVNRSAQYGIFVIKHVDALPKNVGWFNELDENKLVCALASKQHGELLYDDILSIALAWARLKLLKEEVKEAGIDIPHLQTSLENVKSTLAKFKDIKTQCTNLETVTEKIRALIDDIEKEIKSQIEAVDTEIKKALEIKR